MTAQDTSAPNPRRGALVMLQTLDPGTRLRLKSGATVEVAENPRDGSWIYVREPGATVGNEELVFAEDVAEVVE